MLDMSILPQGDKALNDFQSAMQAVLMFLQKRLGFQLWILTRLDTADGFVLSAQDQDYDIQTGDVLNWQDSLYCRMVGESGPIVIPDIQQSATCGTPPLHLKWPIRAYIGIPIRMADGSLFGALCGLDPQPQPNSLTSEVALLELLASLLSSLVHQELRAQEYSRLRDKAEAESQRDALTGIFNRRGWERLILSEEARCRRYGQPASIIMIDLDDLKQVNDREGHRQGDRLLQQAAHTIQESIRSCDVVARLGGDEFGVLLVSANLDQSQQIVTRMRQSLLQAGVRASLGWAARSPQSTLAIAFEKADQYMYANKLQHRHELVPSGLSFFNCRVSDS